MEAKPSIKTPKDSKGKKEQVRNSAHNTSTARRAKRGEEERKDPRKVARTRPSQRSLYHGRGVGCQGVISDGTRRNIHVQTDAVNHANHDSNREDPSDIAQWHLLGDRKRGDDINARPNATRPGSEQMSKSGSETIVKTQKKETEMPNGKGKDSKGVSEQRKER